MSSIAERILNEREELAFLQKDLNQRLGAAISELLEEFQRDTGFSISNVYVSLKEIREIGKPLPEHVLDYVQTELSFDL